MVAPLLTSPESTGGQQAAAAEGLAQIAAALEELAARPAASPAQQAAALAPTVALVLMLAVERAAVPQRPEDSAAEDFAAQPPAPRVQAPRVQAHLDRAAAHCLAAAAALLKAHRSAGDAAGGGERASGAQLSEEGPPCTVLAAAFRILQAPAASPAQLASAQDFVSAAAAALAAAEGSQQLHLAGAGSLLTAAEALLTSQGSSGQGQAPPQLQAVLVALLAWGGSLPAPLPSATQTPAAATESPPAPTPDTGSGEVRSTTAAEPAELLDGGEDSPDPGGRAHGSQSASRPPETVAENGLAHGADDTVTGSQPIAEAVSRQEGAAAAGDERGAPAGPTAEDSDDDFGDFGGSTPAEPAAPQPPPPPPASSPAGAAARTRILQVPPRPFCCRLHDQPPAMPAP